MEPGGWAFLLLSWGLIGGLTVYSLVRTLREKDESPPP
jgi:hypothetical protein